MKYLKTISLALGVLLIIITVFCSSTTSASSEVRATHGTVDPIPSYLPSTYVLPEQKVSIDRDPGAHRYRPQVAFNYNHNEYLVVWHNTWDNGVRRPFARRLDINGKPIGSPFELTNIAVNQVHPFVVYNGTDDVYFVVWMYDVSTTGTRYEIWGSIIPWNATSYGTTFRIGDWAAPSNMWYPSVAWNSLHNEYLVIWDTYEEGTTSTPTNPQSIGYRRVASDGTPGTSGTITTAKAPHESDIVYNRLVDEYVVVWTRKIDDISTGHYVQGALLNWDASISDIDYFILGNYEDQINPAIATDLQYYIVALQDWNQLGSSWDVMAHIINLSGEELTSMGFSSYANIINPDIAAKGKDGEWFLICQIEDSNGDYLYGWRFFFSSSMQGGGNIISIRLPSWYKRIPAVAGNGPGYLITYTNRSSDTSSRQHIYATKIWSYANFFPLISR